LNISSADVFFPSKAKPRTPSTFQARNIQRAIAVCSDGRNGHDFVQRGSCRSVRVHQRATPCYIIALKRHESCRLLNHPFWFSDQVKSRAHTAADANLRREVGYTPRYEDCRRAIASSSSFEIFKNLKSSSAIGRWTEFNSDTQTGFAGT